MSALVASLAPTRNADAQQATPPLSGTPQSAESRRERGERVLKDLEGRDSLPSHFQQLNEDFPELADMTVKYALGDVWGRDVLPPKTRQLVSLAGFAAQGTMPQFKVHAQYALNLGVTPQELMEVIYLTTVIAGSPRALIAAATLKELFMENGVQLPLAEAKAGAPATTPDASVARALTTATSKSADATAVAALHREWILVGWERKVGDGPLDFRQKLGKYYNWSSSDVLLYDDFDPQRRVVRSPAAYGAIWEPPFSALRSAEHRVVSGPSVLVSGDLATSTLEFAARLTDKEGKETGIRTFSSLVWRSTAEGWKIVREHNSSTVLSPTQLAALMNPASNR